MGHFKFDFNRAAQETYQMHPALQKNMFFADLDKGEMIEPPHPNLLFRLIRTPAINFVKKCNIGYGIGCASTVTHRFIALAGKTLAGNLAQERFCCFSTDPDKERMGIFDHEVGHIVVKDALHNTHSRADEETRADLYADLRTLQRFGIKDTGAVDLGFTRLNEFLVNPDCTDYLTTLAVDHLKIDSQTADFISLTPQQTAKLAEHYAEKYLLSHKTLQQLKQDFRGLKRTSALRADHLQPLEAIANITLTAPVDSLSFYMGARALNGYMHLYEETLFNGADADKWHTIRTTLDERIQQSTHGDTLRYFADNAASIIDYLDPQPKTVAPQSLNFKPSGNL
jgi:hypothetical protein